MTADPSRVPPSREALAHHLKIEMQKLSQQGADRSQVVALIASLGEGWR